ncbi:hypothetical protein ADICYQ_5283 [Cyclobacterium qasimii M12-11B]|uniref:Uncharacterized protein n=1 Tax=Cyclobacterium qasimii M12-11B TaxID=641524 RepID=S7WG30_9BACT|nr:hypothetical protein ADICYQ_5283 [Cyclobacterium qasimii M12-11B]
MTKVQHFFHFIHTNIKEKPLKYIKQLIINHKNISPLNI